MNNLIDGLLNEIKELSNIARILILGDKEVGKTTFKNIFAKEIEEEE